MSTVVFKNKYEEIKNFVKKDFDILEYDIRNLFKDENPLNKQLSDFLTAPAKRLRPLLGFLFLRCLWDEISPDQHKVFLAVELIHNATLIHDDVIDNAEKRRNRETLNVKFDNNLAVVAGDFLLSVAMENIINTGSVDVIKICTSALKSTCLGEINQYFSKFGVTSIDKYIEKSEEKTALLFQIGILGGLLLSKHEIDEDLRHNAADFAQNFGIAFQIRDDLINLLDSDKISNNDFSLGIYTAPIIFAYEENKNILQSENIFDAIKKTKGIERTRDLMDNYFNKSFKALENINDSIYKNAILELITLLRNI